MPLPTPVVPNRSPPLWIGAFQADKVLLATAGGNPPDIAGLWDGDVVPFAEQGALTPLDDYLGMFPGQAEAADGRGNRHDHGTKPMPRCRQQRLRPRQTGPTQSVRVIHQHDAVLALEAGPGGADRHAGRLGALLAEVDYVLVGAGNPAEVPALIDRLARRS